MFFSYSVIDIQIRLKILLVWNTHLFMLIFMGLYLYKFLGRSKYPLVVILGMFKCNVVTFNYLKRCVTFEYVESTLCVFIVGGNSHLNIVAKIYFDRPRSPWPYTI